MLNTTSLTSSGDPVALAVGAAVNHGNCGIFVELRMEIAEYLMMGIAE